MAATSCRPPPRVSAQRLVHVGRGLLLCDGAGPLYRVVAGDDGSLRREVEAALRVLGPPADW